MRNASTKRKDRRNRGNHRVAISFVCVRVCVCRVEGIEFLF